MSEDKFELLPAGLDVSFGRMRVYAIQEFRAGPVRPTDVAIIQFRYLDDLGPPETFANSPPYVIELSQLRPLIDALEGAARDLEQRQSKGSAGQPTH